MATQKLMESDCLLSSDHAVHKQPEECECAIGNECHVKAMLGGMFKDYFRGQMVRLMRKIIDDACDSNDDCAGDPIRVKNLKNEMDVVRDLKNSWPDVTSLFIYTKEPISEILRTVLNVLADCSDELGVTEVLCMYTFVTDLSVSLMSKNEKTDIDEIVVTDCFSLLLFVYIFNTYELIGLYL